MARTVATAPYWTQPRSRTNPYEPPRRSPRLRKKEASDTERTRRQPLPTNPQSASPLFRVPREIRDLIFRLALTTYEDPTRPYDIETQVPERYQSERSFPHNRPGHYHLRTDTALLRTCRLIYNETALLPVSANTHTLCYPDIHVLSFPMSIVATSYFKRMTSTQLAAVQHIQIFTNRSRLTAEYPGRYISYSAFAELAFLRGEKGKKADERAGTRMCGIGGPYPKRMMITIRNCDWRFRNHTLFNLDNILRNRHWETILGGLRELRMELEVEYIEKEVLMPGFNRLKEFDFKIGGGESLIAEKKVKESGWVGPIKRRSGYPLEDKWEETKYYVARLVWKTISVGRGSAG